MTDQTKPSMANYMALESAVVNGEEQLVKKLLGNQAMLDIEKSYLIDLAGLKSNPAIIKLLEAIPVRD